MITEVNGKTIIPTKDLILHRGDIIQYTANACRLVGTNIETDTDYYLVDGREWLLGRAISKLPAACYHDFKSISLQIPDTIDLGEHHIEIDSHYHVNFLRTINKTFEVQGFIIK